MHVKCLTIFILVLCLFSASYLAPFGRMRSSGTSGESPADSRIEGREREACSPSPAGQKQATIEAAEKETGEIDKKRDKEQEVEEEPQVGPPHRQDQQE